MQDEGQTGRVQAWPASLVVLASHGPHLLQCSLPTWYDNDDVGTACVNSITLGLRAALIHLHTQTKLTAAHWRYSTLLLQNNQL